MKQKKSSQLAERNAVANEHREMCYADGKPPQFRGLHNGEKRGKSLQPRDKDGSLLPLAKQDAKARAKLMRRLNGFTEDALDDMLSQKWRPNMEMCKPGSMNRRNH
jgi:hypothetical protein